MSRNNDLRRSMLDELLEGQPASKKQKTTYAPVSTLMLDGQRAFDQGRYKDAIKHFTQAINNMNDRRADLVHAYDLRCRAYIRNSSLDEALNDAKQMIRVDRADTRGYLKCAQIEQLQGKLPAAIQICKHGLKSIRSSEKAAHSKLEACLRKLQAASQRCIVYEKQTDPMSVLPTELLDLVIDSFDHRQAVAVMRVSKQWRLRLRSSDIISQTIDTRDAKKTLTYEQMKAAFARLGKSPRELILARLNDTAARFASSELAHWIRWESLQTLVLEEGKLKLMHLRWEKLPNLKRIRMTQNLPADLGDLLGRCPQLEVIDLNGIKLSKPDQLDRCLLELPLQAGTSLRELTLCPATTTYSIKFPDRCLFPKLQKLELGRLPIHSDLDLSQYTTLTELKLASVCIESEYSLKLPPQLERFTVDAKLGHIFSKFDQIKIPRGLKAMSVRGPDTITLLTYASRFSSGMSALRQLSIADFILFENNFGRQIVHDLETLERDTFGQGYKNVEALALQDDSIVDATAGDIRRTFPTLYHLDVEAPHITEAFLTDIVRHHPTLTRVTLRNCPKIGDEVVRWAEARGVNVFRIRRSWQDDAFGGWPVRSVG